MKTNANNNVNKTRRMALVALSLVVVLLLSVGVTLAWFINYQLTQLGGSTVTVTGSRVLQFSFFDEENPDQSVYVSQATQSFEEYGLTHVTGNGIDFWIPSLEQQDSSASVDVGGTWTKALATDGTAPGDYISLCLKFFSEDVMDVYLSAESSVLPATESNPSNYGDFSRNNIASASRISFLNTTFDQEWNKTEQFNFVWIPNVNGQLIETNGRFFFNLNGTPETSYSYYYINSNDEKVSATFNATQYITAPTAQIGAEAPQDGMGYVTTLQEGENGQCSAYVTINIWVEGCDRECRRALAGGHFDVYLQFIGITTQQ